MREVRDGAGVGSGRQETNEADGGAGLGGCARRGVSSKNLLSRAGAHWGRCRRAAGVGAEAKRGEVSGARVDEDGRQGVSDLEPSVNGRAGSRSSRGRERSERKCRAYQASGIGTGNQAAGLTQVVYIGWGQRASWWGRSGLREVRSESGGRQAGRRRGPFG